MGRDRRIIDSAENEALVTAALDALKVELIDSAGVTLEDLETALNNLEEALHSVNTDYLKVQARDAAGNLMPSMDTVARKGFVAITDGTSVLDLLSQTSPNSSSRKGIMAQGHRQTGNQVRTLPIANFADGNTDKGQWVIPVTPITGLRKEGTFVHSLDTTFSVAFGVDDISAKAAYVLIDLSDAANYPHTNIGEIHVDWVSITLLGDATATGEVHVGFISAVDADKGTMHAIAALTIDKLEGIVHSHDLLTPSAIRCKLGAHLSGGTELHTDDTLFQTDTALTATFDTVIPAVGDLVLLIDRTAGTFKHTSVIVGYHTEA